MISARRRQKHLPILVSEREDKREKGRDHRGLNERYLRSTFVLRAITVHNSWMIHESVYNRTVLEAVPFPSFWCPNSVGIV